MILVDTSIWVDHFRNADLALVGLLESDQVFAHSFVIGEIACGTPKMRRDVIALLRSLPQIFEVTSDEVLHFIETHRLMGQGAAYVDMHLLGATVMTAGTRLWTRDAKLQGLAQALAVEYSEPLH